MRQTYRTAGYLAGLVFILVSVSFGQSLGDVARQQRQKEQAKKDQPAPKVITNEDLPEHAQADSDSEQADRSHESVPHHTAKSAEQWKAEIEAQKHAVNDLQDQMDRLSGTIHYVEANRYYNGVQHNLSQEQKELQILRMQQQLDAQKKRLDDMQEAARKDGFGNAVYEP
jgi:hypothetical protein